MKITYCSFTVQNIDVTFYIHLFTVDNWNLIFVKPTWAASGTFVNCYQYIAFETQQDWQVSKQKLCLTMGGVLARVGIRHFNV